MDHFAADNLTSFNVLPGHIKLLRHAYVGWDHCEFGAPSIDCKRPYGNSSVYTDIAEILGIESDDDGEFTEEEEDMMLQLHIETQIALQIILDTGEMIPGSYTRELYGRWSKVNG